LALLQVKSPRIMPDRTPSGWKIDLFNNAVQMACRPAHQLAQVRCAAINGDLSERLALFRQRMNEMPAEIAAFLNQRQRVEELLPQRF